MNTNKLWLIALTCITLNLPLLSMDHGAGDNAEFARRATDNILRGEIKKVVISGSILMLTTITSGVGLRAAVDLYKTSKSYVHRKIWGPTHEDMLVNAQLEKDKKLLEEKGMMIRATQIKLEKEELGTYIGLMENRIELAKDQAEKDLIKQTRDTTLTQLSEVIRNRMLTRAAQLPLARS
jgi:hypothetical protein